MAQQNNQKKPSKLLIYCEGETEKQYLTALAEALKITPNVSIRKTAACSPIQLLESAYKDYQWAQVVDKQYPFTEYWLVFDRDHHPSYEETFRLAATMDPKPHLAWTNPCIEFWFWLHYCGNRANLKFDEETEVSNVRTEKVLENDEVEITTVRRVRRTIKPETMLKLLRGYIQGYSKVVCPPGLVARSGTACDNLVKVAQSKNPMAIGSALPELLLRLANLQDEIHPPKAPVSVSTTQTSAVAPGSTETKPTPPTDQPKPVETKAQPIVQKTAPETTKTAVPPATLTITVKAPTGKTTVIPLTEKPEKPKAAPVVQQTPTPTVIPTATPTISGTAPTEKNPEPPKVSNPITVGWSASSRPGSTSEGTSTPESCQSHQESETPASSTAILRKLAPTDPHQPLLEPLKLCLRDWAFIHVTASGLDYPPGALVHFEKFFTKAATIGLDCKTRDRGNIGLGALKNIRKLITANEADPNEDRPEKIAGRLYAIGNLFSYFAQDLGISELLKGLSFEKQKPTEAVSTKPLSSVKGSGADAPETKAVSATALISEKTPEEQLSQSVEELQRLRNRFYALMSGMVMASDGAKAYEMTKGYCERSAELQEEAVRILNACTELATAAPTLNKGEG